MLLMHESRIRYGKTIRTACLILCVSILAGYLLLALCYALPFHENSSRHQETALILQEEGVYPEDTFSGRHQDNWSDSYAILIAAYEGPENAFEKASNAYFMQNSRNPYDWLSGTVTDPPHRSSYSRYWHGYLLFLRPLMSFLNIRQIRHVNSVCLFTLLVIVLISMMRRQKKLVLPFLLMLLLLAPTVLGNCFVYARIVYIMLLMCLLIVADPKFMRSRSALLYLFLSGGILTAYVDLLSAPLLTVSVPLTVLCVRDREEKGLLKTAFLCLIFWGAGYACMWAGKWGIALLWQRREFLSSLFYAFALRSSPMNNRGMPVSRLHAVRINFIQVFINRYLDFLIVLYGGLIFLESFIRRKTVTKQSLLVCLFLFFLAVLAPLWYWLLANHSVGHYWLHTYRTGVTAVFAVLCALDMGDLCSVRKEKTPDKTDTVQDSLRTVCPEL